MATRSDDIVETWVGSQEKASQVNAKATASLQKMRLSWCEAGILPNSIEMDSK